MYQPYADVDFYKTIYKGELTDDNTIEKMLIKASRDVDILTYNRIVRRTFDKLTDYQKGIVQEAVCMQVDFLVEYGEFVNSPIASYSAGSTSVTFDKTKLFESKGVTTSLIIAGYLESSGLMARIFI